LRGALVGLFEVAAEPNLAVHLGLDERKLPFMQLLPAFFIGFAAQFRGLFLFLRFEANRGSFLFGSEL
jgi:hypothetical protein